MLDGLDLLKLLAAALATYRLAQLVSKDDGPLDIFARLRLWSRKRTGYWQTILKSESMPIEDRMIAEYMFPFHRSLVKLLECPYCLGVWFAAFCLLLVMWQTIMGDIFLAWLAIAGAQTFLQEIGDNK